MLSFMVVLALTASPVCRVDADCAVVVGCNCGCCGPGPLALPREEARRLELSCASRGACVAPTDCHAVQCEAPEALEGVRAICRAGACFKVAKQRKPSPAKVK